LGLDMHIDTGLCTREIFVIYVFKERFIHCW